MELEPLLARFVAEYQAVHSISADRRVTQLRLLRRLAGQLDHPLDQLSGQDVTTFIGAMLASGISPNTGRTRLGMVKSFATWAGSVGLMDTTLTGQIKLVRNPRGSSGRATPKPYKATEIRELRALMSAKYPALPQHGRGSRAMAFFLRGRPTKGHQGVMLRRHLWRHARRLQFEAQIALALELGLRRIEIMRLTVAAVHYDNDQVVVLTAKQGPGLQVTRAVPYTSHARTCVQDWLDFRALLGCGHDSPWLALTYTGALDDQIAPLAMAQMKDSLAVFGPQWHWHRLRHTCATEWLRAKVPLEKVRIYMGHSSIDQTLEYTEIIGRDIDEAFGGAEADFARRLGLAA